MSCPARAPTREPFRLFLVLLSAFGMLLATCSDSAGPGAGGGDDPCANALGNGGEIISGPDSPAGPHSEQVFRSLAVDPSDASIVYVGTEGNGIVKTTNGGMTWRRLRQGMRHAATAYPEVWDIAVSPFDPSLVLTSTVDSPGPIGGGYPSSIAGVYRSTDGGTTWSRSNCGLVNSSAAAVRFDPGDPLVAVLGISGGSATFSDLLGQHFDGALLRSEDAGLHWSPAAAPGGAGRNAFWIFRAHGGADGSHLVTFGLGSYDPAENLGFLRSADGGRTWSPFAPELRALLIAEFDVSADGRTLYAVERDAFEVRKSTDGGVTWSTLRAPANGPVRVSPADPDLVLVCENERVFRSADGLVSTDPVLTTPGRADDIEFAPSDPDVVYLATEGYDVYRSTNAGASWSHLVNLRADGVLE